VGPQTLEPVIQCVLEHARAMKPAQFMAAMAHLNTVRRQLGAVFAEHDLWLTPTTARTAEPWGRYHLGRADLPFDAIAPTLYAPVCQYTLPHNIMGTPALSLPLGNSRDGLPIGVQLAARPAQEHLLLQLGTQLEAAMPWAGRVPALHAGR
jgi:amidase